MDDKEKKLIKEIQDDSNIVAMFDYGSRVYKTNTEISDRDVVVVLKNHQNDLLTSKLIEQLSKIFDVTAYSEEQFLEKVNLHDIDALECMYLPNDSVYKNELIGFNIPIHLPTLRHSVSQKASNSWVKAKKKFSVEADFDPYIGKKSAWHSIRILDFGTQIATNQKIINYTSVNHLYQPIMNCQTWEELELNFKKVHNEYASKFRLHAPKEINLNNSQKP